MATEGERKLRRRIGGLKAAATVDTVARARHANEGLRRSFYDKTDESLPESVRLRQADCLFRAHMVRLQYRSAKARRLRKEQRQREAAALSEALDESTPA